MRLSSIPMLVGFHLFTLSSALAQTTAPGTPSPAPTAEGGIANWWWVILIVVLAAIAIWYYTSRKRP